MKIANKVHICTRREERKEDGKCYAKLYTNNPLDGASC